MTAKTRAELLLEINTNLADNNVGAITPAIERQVFKDLNDSVFNPLSDTFTGDVSNSGEVATVTGTAEGAAIARTLAKHFSDQYYAKDWGALGDGTTDDTAAIQAALDSLHTNFPNGSILLFSRGTYVASQIKIYRNQILRSADGVQACILLQKAASNKDFIISENFATLTGTGANYGTNANVPSWFGIWDMHIDGNASAQGAGAWRGIAWYGNAQLMIGHNFIQNCKQDNIYTEASGQFAYSVTDWRSEEEGFFDHVISRNAGRYGWLNRGPHDSVIVDYIAPENASTGYRSETSGSIVSGAPAYVGSAHILSIHTYAESDGTGQYYGSQSTVVEAYSDFDNVTIAASSCMFGKLFQIQGGYQGLNMLEITSAATFCSIGEHSMDFIPSATNIIGVNVQSGGGGLMLGQSRAALVPGTSGITYYKIRSDFCTIGNVLAANCVGAGSIAFDIAANYTTIKGSAFSCIKAISYTPGNNNNVELNTYNCTTVISGTPGTTDSFKISAETGFMTIMPGMNITSGAFDSAGNSYINLLAGVVSGYNIVGYQTQFTQKGAEANDAFSKQAPSTGFTINVGLSCSHLLLDPSGTLATGTINFPSAPVNGQKLTISSTQIQTALTLAAAGATIKNPATALTAGQAVGWIYDAGNTTWYRIQ